MFDVLSFDLFLQHFVVHHDLFYLSSFSPQIEEKYKIPTQTIKNIYRKNKVG